MTDKCLECGTAWSDGKTCQDYFHQMLFWEAENPSLGVIHHLMVLCYHLQHPSLYSPEGLDEAKRLLVEFLEHGATPDKVRKRNRASVDSSKRKWKIKGTAISHGLYELPIQWTMTAADVKAGGAANYCDNVRRCAVCKKYPASYLLPDVGYLCYSCWKATQAIPTSSTFC